MPTPTERNRQGSKTFFAVHSGHCTPPSKKSVILVTTWVNSTTGEVRFYVSAEKFSEFFPLSAEGVQDILGHENERVITSDQEAKNFCEALDKLFASLPAGE